ncbi:PR domain zinc finger protein 5 [Orchesella cincta]|uniref:PR domain zinc finger protein 5 n=1 Tax=Orchesella cincta TaxID=48709 RepID=A0A1D2NL73_ORCCI|nr:PR domain zinc finger protein 5 [Orchesella cincta]
MAEIKLVEVVPELNRKCDMGRVVVLNSFPAALRPRVTGKIYFCCNRAFLTDASLEKHRTIGGCLNGGSLSKDEFMSSNKEEQATETESIELSIPSTVKCPVDESSCKFENNDDVDSTTDGEECKVPLNFKWIVPARKKGNALQLKEERGMSPSSPDIKQEQDSIEIKSFASDFSPKRMAVMRHVKSPHKLKTTLEKENTEKRVQEGGDAEESNIVPRYSNEKAYNYTTPISSKRKDYSCDLCSYTVQHLGSFKWHKKNAHVLKGKFPCTICACVYRTKSGLGVHLSIFHKIPVSYQRRSPSLDVQKNVTDECNGSKKMEHFQGDITGSYIRLDSMPVDNCSRFSCNLCPYKTVSDQHLRKHMKGAHDPSSRYECPHCLCRYKLRSPLLCHITKMHHTMTSNTPNSLYSVSSNKSFLVDNWIQSINCNEGESDDNIAVNEPSNSPNMEDSSHRYICKSCSMTFPLRIHLVSHYRQQHMRKSSSRTMANEPLNGPQKLLSKNDFAYLQSAFNMEGHELACHLKQGSCD